MTSLPHPRAGIRCQDADHPRRSLKGSSCFLDISPVLTDQSRKASLPSLDTGWIVVIEGRPIVQQNLAGLLHMRDRSADRWLGPDWDRAAKPQVGHGSQDSMNGREG